MLGARAKRAVPRSVWLLLLVEEARQREGALAGSWMARILEFRDVE